MLDATKKLKFLHDGLVHYPDARETVDYFQTTVIDAILAAFEARNWKNFKPLRDSEGSLQSGRAIGAVDRYIQGTVGGTLANRSGDTENVTLYLFLFWNPPLRPKANVVAACVAWSEKKPIQLLDLSDRDQRVVLGLVKKKGELCLLLEPTKDFDPAEAFPLLLHSIDEAMGSH